MRVESVRAGMYAGVGYNRFWSLVLPDFQNVRCESLRVIARSSSKVPFCVRNGYGLTRINVHAAPTSCWGVNLISFLYLPTASSCY